VFDQKVSIKNKRNIFFSVQLIHRIACLKDFPMGCDFLTRFVNLLFSFDKIRVDDEGKVEYEYCC